MSVNSFQSNFGELTKDALPRRAVVSSCHLLMPDDPRRSTVRVPLAHRFVLLLDPT